MKAKSRQSGVTLTEMTVVVAVIALLVTFGLPAIRAFRGAFESGGSAKGLISAGLATARAIAAREHRYAGIRCQQDLHGYQYMIFIVHDFDETNLANGFRAVEGLKPIKLPETIGVMDLYTRGVHIIDNGGIDESDEVLDTTTFSIVFSPAGKLVVHDVRTIFNDQLLAIFQDDSSNTFPYQQELSRNSFIIYDRKEFKHAYENGQGYLGCLEKLVPETVYVNPYTGTIISVD